MAAGRVVSLSPASPYALPTDGSFNRAPEVQPRAVGLSLVVGAHESCTDDGEYHRNDHEGKDAAECQLAVPSHLHALEHAERYEHDCNSLALYSARLFDLLRQSVITSQAQFNFSVIC